MTPNQIQFKTYISANIELTVDEFEKFFACFKSITLKKGELLLSPNMICRNQYFILEGLLVSYEFDDKGFEKVIQISTENSWTADLESFTHATPTVRFIKAAENCELLAFHKKYWSKMLDEVPALEKLFRILYQQAYLNQTKRVSIMLKSDAKNRFGSFCDAFPYLVQRADWKTIASYLDMTPETLSRIKNNQT
jgi:CRP-like cAMP-binding protein